MVNNKVVEWTLRIAVAGEFLGHGLFAVGAYGFKTGWVKFFEVVGLTSAHAETFLPLIGYLDILVAVIVLVYPIRIAVLWAAVWGFWTALLRPLTGDPVIEFIEKLPNIGAPLALLFLLGWPRSIKGLFNK